MAKFNFTLLYVSIAFVVAVSANADSFGPHRRDHADVGRLLKKRMPAGPPALGGLSLPPSPTSSDSTSSSSISSAVTQATPGSSTSTGPSPSSTNGGGSSSSSSTGSSPSSSSTSSTVSSATSTTSGPSSDGPEPSSVSPSKSVVYLTTSLNSAPTATQSSTSDSSSALSHTAVTVLIILAACVGASVIAWTIIRKWKFRPSSDFEGRMQPIDWEPGVTGGGGDEDPGLPGHRRALSRSSSFHSGSANGHAVDGGAPANGYGGAPLNPIPDHDFTAGPANLAPVGGYADLARGIAPQPMMQEHGLAPSVNRPAQYEQYGIPPHHGYSGY